MGGAAQYWVAMTDAPVVPPLDPGNEREADQTGVSLVAPSTDERRSPPNPPSTPEPRWLGYRPRTLMILGVLVVVVLVAEAQWLYSPFGSSGSTTVAVSTTDPGGSQSSDPGVDDSTEVPLPDPGAGLTYQIRSRVTIRSGPTSTTAVLGHLAAGTKVTVTCSAPGEAVSSPEGANSRWDRVTVDSVTGYITDALVSVPRGSVPTDQIPAC
jgi:hypothetical protein